tara:strand:- start:101 stop:343 length:243 start_codon:yes stop_codon:yes gene_type:complete
MTFVKVSDINTKEISSFIINSIQLQYPSIDMYVNIPFDQKAINDFNNRDINNENIKLIIDICEFLIIGDYMGFIEKYKND